MEIINKKPLVLHSNLRHQQKQKKQAIIQDEHNLGGFVTHKGGCFLQIVVKVTGKRNYPERSLASC